MGRPRGKAFAKTLARITAAVVFVRADGHAAPPAHVPTETQSFAGMLSAREGQSYAAWKSGETKFWAGFLSNKFVGWGPSGRLDKAAASKALSGSGCQIATYRLSSEQVSRLTPDAAVLTHRTEVDGVCGGKRLAPASYVATVYVREGDQWKAAFRAQSTIVDPLKATKPVASDAWTDGPTRTDAGTQALLARERAVWSAWRDRDAKRIDELLGSNIQFIDIFGDHIANRAETIKAWSGEGCAVKGFGLTGAKATMFSSDLGVLTFRGTAKGKCFGQDVWPIWGSTVYVKQGDTWMWTFGINVLAGSGW
ncbi:MAG: nuclear transport factor 2 family protein [Sphingomicrobium sp.]